MLVCDTSILIKSTQCRQFSVLKMIKKNSCTKTITGPSWDGPVKFGEKSIVTLLGNVLRFWSIALYTSFWALPCLQIVALLSNKTMF